MTLNLAKAALRHRRCADKLATELEQSEACYLVGLAAECAIKHHLIESGFPLVRQKRASKKHTTSRPDPLYLHFPELVTQLLTQAQGVLAGRILTRLKNASLASGWSVRMRYSDQPSSPAVVKRYKEWRATADEIFMEVGL